MKRLALFFLILVLILPTMVNADNLLENGEIILDERLNPNGTKEIFTEIDGIYYRKIIKDGDILKTEPIELRPTGLKFHKEEKDRDIGQILPKKLKQMGIYSYNLPAKLDYSNSEYLPPVGRQMENSCVGWSVGYYLRTYQQGLDLGWKIKDGERGNHYRIFSPSFIYNQINGGTDDGAYMEDAGDLLMRVGAAPLSYFPYIGGDYWTQPDSRAIQAAYPHRIRDWKIVYTKNDSKNYIIQKTKEYLNTGDLMVAGIRVGFKFNYPYFDEYHRAIITTDNYANYGHAVVIVGYDDNLETPEGYGAFKIINSYGKEWGNDGFAYMSYDAYVSAMQGGYVFTDLVNEDYMPEIENLRGEPISPTKYKIKFDKVLNASGYRLLDENKKVLSNFYTNEYIINIDRPKNTIMYIQPFNQYGLGNINPVKIDTTDITQTPLNVEILEGVLFNIDFRGRGIYDMEIIDKYGNGIYGETNLIGKTGMNEIYWNGLNYNKAIMEDGEYTIKLLDTSLQFMKEAKLNSASSYLNKHNGIIKSTDINLSTKKPGTMNLYIETHNKTKLIYKDLSLDANKDYNYNIDILHYINLNELKDAKILIEIR